MNPDETVAEILARKKASVRRVPLPQGAPSWSNIGDMTWAEVDLAAKTNQPGFKTIRKLLSDKRFEK